MMLQLFFRFYFLEPFDFNRFLVRRCRWLLLLLLLLLMFFGVGGHADSLRDFLLSRIPPNQLRLFVNNNLIAIFAPNVKKYEIKLTIFTTNVLIPYASEIHLLSQEVSLS
jgi:hypothetical protein